MVPSGSAEDGLADDVGFLDFGAGSFALLERGVPPNAATILRRPAEGSWRS
jgi:hypothetical protein